ncbi:uncharacterized protein LOC119569109 [Penaeus monodon]|uniref:uncharacterized protein LOC119569109 n=1 Tax=Penaeus monodon TaxID=6687 RepID=UPI0018A7578C|nr:uncharacterized protein LOC119569109 [Penaeus monodon]
MILWFLESLGKNTARILRVFFKFVSEVVKVKFIKGYSNISSALVDLTKGDKTSTNKKNLLWTPQAVDTFEKLKGTLSDDIVLRFPDFKRKFVLVNDASKFALGSALQQEEDEGALRPLSYFSRQLRGAELNYSTVEREALAIVFGLKVNRTLIQGYPVEIHSDHKPLVYLFENRDGSDRLARWRMTVANFDIRLRYLPGKDNVLADALSRIREADHSLDDLLVGGYYPGRRKTQRGHSGMSDTSQEVDPLRVLQDYQLHLVGLLYNVMVNPYNMKICRVIVPLQLQDTAVQLAHSLPVSGHGGVLATLVRFRKFAFFSGMRRVESCKQCEVCIRCKPGREVPVPLLHFPDVTHPFQRVHMDLVGPFPSSHSSVRISNEQVERVNGVLTKILRTMVVDNPENWSLMLPMATLAYNTAYHRIIRDSLLFALKQRDPQ